MTVTNFTYELVKKKNQRAKYRIVWNKMYTISCINEKKINCAQQGFEQPIAIKCTIAWSYGIFII